MQHRFTRKAALPVSRRIQHLDRLHEITYLASIQDKNNLYFHPVSADFVIFDRNPMLHDPQASDAPEGAGGPGETHLDRIIKALGGFSDNMSYPGDISSI
jgi:hypothetical protein